MVRGLPLNPDTVVIGNRQAKPSLAIGHGESSRICTDPDQSSCDGTSFVIHCPTADLTGRR